MMPDFEPKFMKNKLMDIPTEELLNVLSRTVLFQGRWGFTKGRLSNEEYQKIIETKAKPALEKLIRQDSENPVIECRSVFGFYKCYSEDNSIIVDLPEPVRFSFPRKADSEQPSCLADFVNESNNFIAFFATTIGSKIIEAEKKLFDANCYYDYHLLHGLGAELADCGAVVTHRKLCEELVGRKLELTEKPFGCRYSFGYPACPELAYQKLLFNILQPSKIGIFLTESCQMVPELSVSGFVLFNPSARYIVP